MMSNLSGVHLVVDAAVTHQDLEGTLVAPCVVPRVDAQPVVITVFMTPADDFDGVTTERSSTLVLVDTRLVCKEIFID